MNSVALVKHWTEKRKIIYWKLFAARSEELEARLIPAMRAYFKEELTDVLVKLEREGKKIEGRYSGWSRLKVQKAVKEDKDVSRINIDRKKEAKRLRTVITPLIKGVMAEYGEERIQDLLESIKVTINFNVNDPEVLQWIGDRMMRFSKEVTGISFESIAQIVRRGFAEGEPLTTIADTLRGKFQSWDKYRAPLISRTETLSAMNRADLFAVEQSGLEEELLKHWLSSRDADTRKTHLDADLRYAKGIPTKEMFEVGTDKMLHPGGGVVAEENINCRCTLYYSKKEKAEEIRPREREGGFQFVPPKTERELHSRLRDVNINPYGFEGYSKEEVLRLETVILQQTEEMVYKLPVLKERLAGKGKADLILRNVETLKIPRSRARANGYWDPLNSQIVLATKGKPIGDQLHPGSFLTGDDLGSLTRHEYGHYLYDRVLARKEFEEWRRLYSGIPKSTIKKTISEYAGGWNFHEFFAESFAFYTSPLYGEEGLEGAMVLPKIILNYLELQFGTLRGAKAMHIVKPKCWERECKHFLGIEQRDKKDPLSLFPICHAFPDGDGIPEEISYGSNLHLEPFPGDHGIQYEPRQKKED